MITLEEDVGDCIHDNQQVTPAFEDYNFDARWWTGPIDKIQGRLAQVADDAELAVLVTTGAFCPIHKGHIQMLETAKRELEVRGMAVLGGYICPDHDRYVSSKIRAGSISAAQRLELCELAVEDSEWLMVDRWAAIYAPSAVGFTTIVGHIDKMINHHIKSTRPIRMVYVFGGDNAMFAFSFVTRWSCVCVSRPGSSDYFQEMVGYDSLRRNPKIIFSHETTPSLDSTSVRNGDLSGLLPKVRFRWLSMRNPVSETSLHSGSTIPPPNTRLHIRNEGLWAVQPFLRKSSCPNERMLEAYKTFCEELQNVYELAFRCDGVQVPFFTIRTVHLNNQRTQFQRLLTIHKNIISLDPCLPGTHTLQVSQISEPLVKPSSFTTIAWPENSLLGNQVIQAEADTYTIFTERLPLNLEIEQLVTQSLPDRWTIAKQLSHADLKPPGSENITETQLTYEDITINARDFLAGAQEGGTMLQLGEAKIVRAPNILPYVRPFYRAHIDTKVEMGFSNAIWKLNHRFFRAVGSGLVVKDMAPHFQVLCQTQGFPEDMRMSDLCEWHIRAFKDMIFDEL